MYNKFRFFVNYINLFAAIFFAFSMILWEWMQQPALYLFYLSFLIEIFTDKKWENLKFERISLWCFAVLLIYILAFLYIPFEQTSDYFLIVIKNRFPLLAFAVIILFKVNNLFKLRYFLDTFIITSLITILYLALYRVGIYEFILSENRFDLFNSARIQWINSHTVFNFYLNIAIISICYILSLSWNKIKRWEKFYYFITSVIILLAISISEGRSGFLMMILIVIGFIFFELYKRNKKVALFIALLTPVFILGLVSQKERFSNKVLENEPRLILWNTAFDIVKTAPFFGHGISDSQNEFIESLIQNQSKEFIINNLNNKILDAHNQYLQSWMEFGVLGLFLLVFIYIFPIFIIEKKIQVFTFFLIATVMFQSVFDVFLSGIFSGLFGFLMMIILAVPNNITNEEMPVIKMNRSDMFE